MHFIKIYISNNDLDINKITNVFNLDLNNMHTIKNTNDNDVWIWNCEVETIIFNALWNTGNGHVMVIVGYLNVDGVEGVLFNNPWQGYQQFLPYDEFSGTGTFFTNWYNYGTWAQTGYTKPKQHNDQME